MERDGKQLILVSIQLETPESITKLQLLNNILTENVNIH